MSAPGEQVLVLMPTSKDGERAQRMLADAAIEARVARDLPHLCALLSEGAGAVLITEDAIRRDPHRLLAAALATQAPWSALPVVVLSHEGAQADRSALLPESIASITLVERPVRTRTLISVVRASLRARRQQYEIRDAVAERERQALAIAEQGAHLYFALTAGKLGWWELRLPGHELETSELTRAAFGRTGDAAFGYADWVAAIHPADRVRVLTALESALGDGADLEVAHRVQWADGTLRWILVRGRLHRSPDGEAQRLVGVVLDTTELRRNEAALAETRDLYRSLVEQVRDHAIFTVDTSGRTTSWNVGVRRVLGYEEQEFMGLDASALFTPDDRAAGVPARELEDAARDGSTSNDRWMLKKDSAQFFAMGSTTTLRDEGGRLLGFTKVMRDQTEWVQAQEDLARSTRALREADRRKDQFLATLAHELRNPLAPLRTGLEVLALDPAHAPSQRARDVMRRQLGHMVRLIDDLLDVSRITRGKVQLKRERIALDAIIDAAVEGSRPLIDAGQHALTVERAGAPLWVDGDLTRLAQVLSNLLNNAAKYTAGGGHIRVRARAEGGQAVIEVSDDGAGIPPEELR